MIVFHGHLYPELSHELAPCHLCGYGTLTWNETRRAWLCTHDGCKYGLAFGAIFDIDGIDEHALRRGLSLAGLPVTPLAMLLLATGKLRLLGLWQDDVRLWPAHLQDRMQEYQEEEARRMWALRWHMTSKPGQSEKRSRWDGLEVGV